ncbi:hypothetical protein WJX81_005953 [Elliptochloris bilobata]|uniref:FAD-binding PCMH-type domain-containing protein n=1 Tax=Elliptochloris bilobata TaxID=381761 RepID=A0AAW1RYW5_9CHLO
MHAEPNLPLGSEAGSPTEDLPSGEGGAEGLLVTEAGPGLGSEPGSPAPASGKAGAEGLSEAEQLRRQRISRANRGRTPWNVGRPHSAELRKKIAERTFAAMQRPEVRAKLEQAAIRKQAAHRAKAVERSPVVRAARRPKRAPGDAAAEGGSEAGGWRRRRARAAAPDASRLDWADQDYRTSVLAGLPMLAAQAQDGCVCAPGAAHAAAGHAQAFVDELGSGRNDLARIRWKQAAPREMNLWLASLGQDCDAELAERAALAAAAAVIGAQAALVGKLHAARRLAAKLEAAREQLAEQAALAGGSAEGRMRLSHAALEADVLLERARGQGRSSMRVLKLPAAALCLAALLRTSCAGTCRQGPASATRFCALPNRLGNFQGNYDWWQQQFCAGNDSSAINIVTTELRDTLALILNPTYPVDAPPGFPIRVDEAARTVTVAAGVPQRIFLDYLAAYKTAKAPLGYSIPASPWYIDQTVGGAVATGTHGSSLRFGSLSSQVTRIEIALANGTLASVTAVSHPHLWQALQVSVGRLGVITELDFEIVPQQMLTRTVVSQTIDEAVHSITAVSAAYAAALAANASASEIQAIIAPLDMTQLFWFVPIGEVSRVTLAPVAPQVSVASLSVGRRLHVTGAPADAPAPGVFEQTPSTPLAAFPGMAADPLAWTAVYASWLHSYLPNATLTTRDAVLSINDFANRQTSDEEPYDQYEVSVPLQSVGACLKQVAATVAAQDLAGGFVVPPLLRFVSAEGAYLSNAHGGPRMFFNIEDHLKDNTGHVNARFQEVMRIFRQDCGARLHWGKAGWPQWGACFDGAHEYPDSWCHFGCAVQELDPEGRFSGLSGVWAWRATRQGLDVPLELCCTPEGFSAECTCAQRLGCAA